MVFFLLFPAHKFDLSAFPFFKKYSVLNLKVVTQTQNKIFTFIYLFTFKTGMSRAGLRRYLITVVSEEIIMKMRRWAFEMSELLLFEEILKSKKEETFG